MRNMCEFLNVSSLFQACRTTGTESLGTLIIGISSYFETAQEAQYVSNITLSISLEYLLQYQKKG